MYLIFIKFSELTSQDEGHETDIKINLKMNVVCEESKKTSKSISTHPRLRYVFLHRISVGIVLQA